MTALKNCYLKQAECPLDLNHARFGMMDSTKNGIVHLFSLVNITQLDGAGALTKVVFDAIVLNRKQARHPSK